MQLDELQEPEESARAQEKLQESKKASAYRHRHRIGK